MRKKTTELLDKLDQDLAVLAEAFGQYSHEELNRKAKDGGWSAMQCLHHLMLSEKGAQLYVKKKLSFDPKLPNKGIGNALRHFLLVTYSGMPIKFNAPKGIGTDKLPAESDLASALKKWRQSRSNLRNYLGELDDELFDKQVFKHPLAGRVSLDTMLAFFASHFHRHRRQAERAISGS